MAITKTGIQIDTDPTFSNPLEFEAQGEVRSVDATNLEPSTTYYTRAYVVELSKRTYSKNSRTFETLTPNYFTITNRQSTDTTVSILNSASTGIALQYSLDEGKTWVDWNSSMGEFSVTLGDHQAVKLRGVNTTMNNNIFEATDFCDLSGDVNTLINKVGGDIQLPNGCYAGLFLAFWQNYAKFYNAGIVLPSTIIGDDAYASMFYGQIYFSSVPKINASVIGVRAFEGMFSGCTGITSLPSDLFNDDLILTSQCCRQMFLGCTGLTSIPSDLLPFTTLAELCFQEMFWQCSSLRNTPNLPATTLANGCYSYMFWQCSSLTSVPADLLPATTLARSCYSGMFAGASITVPPTLPATTIPELAYVSMFDSTGITEIDLSNVTSVGTRSFEGMFSGCSNLNSVKSPNISTWDTTVFGHWLRDVAATGDFYKGNDDLVVPIDSEDGVPVGWTVRETIGDNFRITNEYNGTNTISLTRDGLQTANISLDYSTDDGSTWTHWDSTDGNLSVPLSSGGSVLLKGDNQRFSDASLDAKWHFDSDHEFSVSGNLMSLLDSTRMRTDVPSYTFSHLFMATKINGIQSGLLPATELSMYCYTYMFAGCQNLTTLPLDLLPATDLYGSGGNSTAINCYAWMFTGCRNLTNCPNLPALDLAMYCYKDMFMGCTSLVYPMAELPSDSIPNFAYESMFSGCTSLVCSSDIKATTFSGSAMHNMFNGCSSLCEITAHIQNWDTNCTGDWVDGVASSGLLFNFGEATITTGTSGIPTNWVERTKDYFNITNEESSTNTITVSHPSSQMRSTDLAYSTDRMRWTAFDLTQRSTSIQVSANKKMWMRSTTGYHTINYNDTTSDSSIQSTGKISAAGDLLTLINYTVLYPTLGNGSYQKLFTNNTNLIDISGLHHQYPYLNSGTFTRAFSGCTSLRNTLDMSRIARIDRPLPANFGGADQMFSGCTSLTTPPNLGALTRAEGCNDMFSGCTGLTSTPDLRSVTSINSSGQAGIEYMFRGCSNITTVYAPNVTNWSTYNSNCKWLQGVAASGTIYVPAGTDMPQDSPSGIPQGWTKIEY